MIYQNPYQNIRTADIYGARKQAGEDKLAAQENQLALQQKQNAFQKAKIVDTYKALNTFAGKSDESKAAQWPTVRAQIVSLSPEMEQELPKDWMSDPVGNQSQLQAALEGMSNFITPERITLRTDEVIQERLPGGKFATIASGPQKEGKGLEIKTTVVGDQYIETPERPLPSGNILRGPYVYDQLGNAMPKEEYFKLYPSERPKDIRPESQNKLNATPQPVPGQTELQPRQFNAPSPTNRAGETNVGFPIDENAMLQQQQIMPTMGNMMLRGAGAVMADEFAPQPRNALVGGMMPQPSQFAELMPAGSIPNRFGSPGVEGIDFAATGVSQPQIVNGRVVYTARPKPGEAKETWRPMNANEYAQRKLDPERISAEISSQGQTRTTPITTEADKKLAEAQLKKAEADAKTAEFDLKKKQEVSRQEKLDAVSLLRGFNRIEEKLKTLKETPLFDTGSFDQAIMSLTPRGKALTTATDSIMSTIKRVKKTSGEGAFSNLDVDLLQKLMPRMGVDMADNEETLAAAKQDILLLYGVQAAVSNKKQRDELPPGTIYVDTNTGIKYQKGEK